MIKTRIHAGYRTLSTPKTERILIVEDDTFVARDLALRLEGLGYSMAGSLNSGEAALERIAALKPDLILMDIVLEGNMDGIEAVRKIQLAADIPLIFLVAYTDRERLDRVLEISPLAYLQKPLKQRELELTIELALLRHRAECQSCADRQELEQRIDELTASNQIMRHMLDDQVAQQRFRSALDYSADAIFLIDRASMRFVDVNQAACKRLAYSREELLEMGPHDIKPYFNQQMLEQRFDEIVASPERFGVIETVHRCRTGEMFPVEVRLGAIESKGPAIMVAVARDITVQRRNKEALLQSEEQFRQITENLKHVLWIGDVQTERLLYINQAFESVWGYSREQAYKRPRMLLAGIHPKDRGRITAAMQGIWRDEHTIDEECRLLRKDGSILWLWIRTFPIHDEKGRVYRIGGVMEDITARKENEENLRCSEEKYRLLFEGAPIGLGMLTQDRHMTEANPALCKMLGYPRDELLTKTLTDITHPEYLDSSVASVQRQFDGAVPHYVTEKKYLQKNGNALWGRLHATVIRDCNQNPLFSLGMIENIDQAKRAEEVRYAQDTAQKNALVREVHHRIKNHLQGVVGLLRRQQCDDSSCNTILEEVVAQISTVATVHGLQGKTVGEEIDLLEMLGAISSTVNSLIPSDFSTRISSALDAPLAISCDESVPVALALNELLVNARKFSSGTVDIELSGSRKNATVKITNPTHSLPQQIRTSGLELVKALLHTEGAAFAFEHGADRFSAKVSLTPPVLKV